MHRRIVTGRRDRRNFARGTRRIKAVNMLVKLGGIRL